jgi:hypothetical protein
MRIIITEEQKKKLFIPRRISSGDSRYDEHNNSQPIKDGKRINQYTPDGLKIGYWEKYYSGGELWYKGLFVNGDRDGYWEEYWYNGKLRSKGNYVNGLEDGYWEEYHDNGELLSKGKYVNGVMDGYWEEYYDNGKLRSKGNYVNGKFIKDKSMNEVSINKKPVLGVGAFHNVYDLYGKDRVIKVPRGNVGLDELKSGGDGAWFNIFKSNPKFFPMVYKVTNKYVILEKLDVNRVKSDLKLIEDDIYVYFSDLIDDGYQITNILYGLLFSSDKKDRKMLKTVIDISSNKVILRKYLDLLKNVGKIIKNPDINDGNFGYDRSGNLKMLDI